MFVCTKCHESDRNVLGCSSNHYPQINMTDSCSICGRFPDDSDDVIWCKEYNVINNKIRGVG